MLSGFEALGAASAVLQVISFATDLAVACKNAYDGATTSQDDLERHSKEMFEAVGRVHTRCEQMASANSRFANANLQTIAHDCKIAAKKLEDEVQYITKIQAKDNVLKSLRKAFRASRHRKTIQTVEESLSRYQHLIHTELMSHLCSQSDAIDLQQERSFHKLDSDIQLLVTQLAKGSIEVKELVKKEHVKTRAAVVQEAARAERAISTHIDTQVLDLKTTANTDQRCKTFLQSLKADCMNQRYNDIMDPRDATFEQVFATYQELIAMYCNECEDDDESDDSCYPENEQGSDGGDSKHDYPQHEQDSNGEDDWEDHDDTDSGHSQPSKSSSDQPYSEHVKVIWSSWESFIKWLQSDEMLFYIQGKPGSGKSTLIKFILEHGQTQNLIHQWNPDATIIRYFFWKIGSHEQNSIKGLWCSSLYQRLQDRLSVVSDILQHFQHLSSHSSYHDWTIKDLQAVWEYTVKLDDRYLCIFIDGLDEIRNADGFSRLIQSIQLLSKLPRTKLCVSTRPEARIMKWLQDTGASGVRLEDLTRHDMVVFVRSKLCPLLHDRLYLSRRLCQDLVYKAQGVFLWLHLAVQSLIEGIENDDSDDMLLRRLDGLPEDLEMLYTDMWQRLNANNSVYRRKAARYFRYILLSRSKHVTFEWNRQDNIDTRFPLRKRKKEHWHLMWPFSFQIACAENAEIQEALLKGEGSIEKVETLRMCEATKASIRTRCAGLLEFKPLHLGLAGNDDEISNTFGEVAFIHRTAHEFLLDTEAGRKILGHDPISDSSLQRGLLKGFICAVVVSSSRWTLTWALRIIVDEIIQFAKHLQGSSLEVAIEVLDAIRAVYDKGWMKSADDAVHYRRPFLSYVTHDQQFDEFVISRLTTANNVQTATDTLREAWVTGSQKTLSKRLLDALISLEADPHQYGTSSSSAMLGPFVSKETAFTNFLVSFYCSRESPTRSLPQPLMFRGCQNLDLQDSCEIIEIAIHLAKSCKNLNANVALIGSFFKKRNMWMQPLRVLPRTLQGFGVYDPPFIVYEINLQFLLLYLLSTAGGDSAEKVLGRLGTDYLLQRVRSPWIKMRYFLLRKAGQGIREKGFLNAIQPSDQDSIPVTCHRVVPQASCLPKHLVEGLLCSPLCRSTEEHLKVDFKRQSGCMSVTYDTQTDVGTITHVIKDTDTEEVSLETMFTSLAHESPEISTY